MNRSRQEYERRINRVVDYIEKNPTAELSLGRLARIADFSPFHFHRVFRAATGETVYGFGQRLRVEKGAQSLLRSEKSVLETAHASGFASAATFARAFKAHFDMSASEWRAGGHRRWRERQDRKHGIEVSKASKAFGASDRHTDIELAIDGMRIQIRKLPSFRVAYMRYVGPYGPTGISLLWARLSEWRTAQKFGSTENVLLGVAYDDPRIAAAQRCRYDACVAVPKDFHAGKLVNVLDTAGGAYAVCHFRGKAADIVAVWERVFAKWLPDSGFEPDDKPCIELYGDREPDSTRTFTCELCLPVRKL
jgi:AraC family transcriptional regulator